MWRRLGGEENGALENDAARDYVIGVVAWLAWIHSVTVTSGDCGPSRLRQGVDFGSAMPMSKVLMVEDDSAMRTVMEKMLRSGDHEVVATGSLQGGLAAARGEQEFDIALVDYWLGKGDATTLLAELKRCRPRLPVVVISGGGGSMSLETTTALAEAAGASDFLYKPFSMSELLKSVTRNLRG